MRRSGLYFQKFLQYSKFPKINSFENFSLYANQLAKKLNSCDVPGDYSRQDPAMPLLYSDNL